MNASACFDVVIVGASVSGIIAAREFAMRGLDVCVIEKTKADDHYKVICSHIMHPNVVNELKGLGLWHELQTAGAQETYLDVVFDGQGHLSWPLGREKRFANVQRRLLDPALRRVLKSDHRINSCFGERVTGLIRKDDVVIGVTVSGKDGETREVLANLVVGADGVSSTLARLDQADEVIMDNGRVGIFAYFERRIFDDATRVWALDGGRCFIGHVPNGDRVILNGYVERERYSEVEDLEQYFQAQVLDELNRRGIEFGERLTPIYVAKRTSTTHRKTTSKGLVLIGDAYLSADVMTGVGCSWAIRSSKLLAQTCSQALLAARAGQHDKLLKQLRWYRLRVALRFNVYGWLIGVLSRDVDRLTHPALIRVAVKLLGYSEKPPVSAKEPIQPSTPLART